MRRRIPQLEKELHSQREEIDVLNHRLKDNEQQYKLLELQSQNTILAKDKELDYQATIHANENEFKCKLAQIELENEKSKKSSISGTFYNIKFDIKLSFLSLLLVIVIFVFLFWNMKPISNFIISFIIRCFVEPKEHGVIPYGQNQ